MYKCNLAEKNSFKFLIAIFLTLSLSACSKSNNGFVSKAVSSFETEVIDIRFRQLVKSDVALVDSNFHFRNLSTGGEGVKYKWDFGDGTESELFSPKHIYTNFGRYKVKLTTTIKSGESAVFEKELVAIAGQKRISLGEKISTGITDLLEMDDQGFLLFGWTKDLNTFPAKERALMVVIDKNFRKWTHKNFPEGYRFNNVSVAAKGSVIVCGTTSNSNLNNELINITLDGNVVWAKKVGSNTNFTHILKVTDGYFLTGTTSDLNGKLLSTNVKTDLSGNEIWSKTYQGKEHLESSGNTVQDGDNFITAGLIRGGNGCQTCDSISIIRFNKSGSLIDRTTISTASSTKGNSTVYVSKLNDGGVVAGASNTRGLYTFSPKFESLLKTNVFNDITHINSTSIGEILLLQQEYVNGFRVSYTATDHNGARKWGYMIDGTQILPDGHSCCADSWAIKAYPLRTAGSVFIANEVKDGSHYRMIVAKIGSDGKLM